MSDQQSLWPLRLLAVVIAVALWLTISFLPRLQELQVETVQREIEATVSYRTPDGFVILNPEQTVTVNVRGREADVLAMTSDSVGVAIPFPENVEPGRIEAPIVAENVTLPQGVNVVDIVPSTLALLIDYRSRKMVPVQPRWSGEPLVGFRVDRDSSYVVPAEVEISGPKTEVDSVFQVIAEVNVDGRGLPELSVQVAPVTNNEFVRVVQPRLVTVEVRMSTVGNPTGALGLGLGLLP